MGFRSSRWRFSISATASGGLIGQLANEHGHRREPREPRGTPAALAGHDLVGLGVTACLRRSHRPDDQRLQDALLADRLGELGEAYFAQLQARLIAPRLELVDR